MDQNRLVADGEHLLERLAKQGVQVETAVWVHDADLDQSRLWIVPAIDVADKMDFYRLIASSVIAEPSIDLAGSNVQLATRAHPLVQALARRAESGRGGDRQPRRISNTLIDGLFVTDAIVLRSKPGLQSNAA